MANKSNNGNHKKNMTFIPARGNVGKGAINNRMPNQLFDKRRKDNAKVKY